MCSSDLTVTDAGGIDTLNTAVDSTLSNTGENAAYLRLVRDHLSGPRLGLKNP